MLVALLFFILGEKVLDFLLQLKLVHAILNFASDTNLRDTQRGRS